MHSLLMRPRPDLTLMLCLQMLWAVGRTNPLQYPPVLAPYHAIMLLHVAQYLLARVRFALGIQRKYLRNYLVALDAIRLPQLAEAWFLIHLTILARCVRAFSIAWRGVVFVWESPVLFWEALLVVCAVFATVNSLDAVAEGGFHWNVIGCWRVFAVLPLSGKLQTFR